jgi:phage-related protein
MGNSHNPLSFIKKTRKTPPREIEQARAKLKDFIERHGE